MAPEPGPGLVERDDGTVGCWWAGDDAGYQAYHDHEWGRPTVDDVRLFEKVCLEGFQAGLSWLTILRKRENFRAAFAGFEPAAVAAFGPSDIERLLADAGIVRHEGKIRSAVSNAARALELIDEYGSLAAYFWEWEPPSAERPGKLDHSALMALAKTPTSAALSTDLKRRGWSFVGPTTMYAFMQAMGLVNDHLEGCSARAEIEPVRAEFRRPVRSGTG